MPTTRTDRERRHQARLDSINRVQCVVGTADRTRVDHEGTLLERARLLEQEMRSHAACEAGLAAFERLLCVAEEGRGARSHNVRAFLRAVRDQHPLPLGVLRMADGPTGDDMLAVLEAWRFARLDLVDHVPGGAARVARVLASGVPLRT